MGTTRLASINHIKMETQVRVINKFSESDAH